MNDNGINSPGSDYPTASPTSWWVPTIILFVLLVFLGFLGYYILNQQVIQPLNEVTRQLDALETHFSESEQVIYDQLDSIESNVSEIETELASLDVRLEVVENSQQTLANEQAQQVDDLASLQTEVTNFDRLTDDLQTIEDMKELIETGVATLQKDVTSATSFIQEFQQNASTLTEEVSVLGTRWQELQNEVEMIKIMELVNRSRTLLSQGNIAQARLELQGAQQLLEGLRGRVADYQVDALEQIAASLDQVLQRISAAPTSALTLLENAWKQLISGLGE